MDEGRDLIVADQHSKESRQLHPLAPRMVRIVCLRSMTTPLGKRLRELREKHDLSLREFAERLDSLSKAHLSDIELGRRNPSPALLEKMATVLGVPLADLQRLDARPPVDEMRRRIEADPALGFAFRQVIEDKQVTGADLLQFLESKRKRE